MGDVFEEGVVLGGLGFMVWVVFICCDSVYCILYLGWLLFCCGIL